MEYIIISLNILIYLDWLGVPEYLTTVLFWDMFIMNIQLRWEFTETECFRVGNGKLQGYILFAIFTIQLIIRMAELEEMIDKIKIVGWNTKNLIAEGDTLLDGSKKDIKSML